MADIHTICMHMNRPDFTYLGLLIAVPIALVLSGLDPNDRLTWWMEVAPVLIGLAVLIPTARRFPLTRLLYLLITLHALILILGGKYTYAQVPLGHWLQDTFDLARNHYDRLGHFAQGFIPAILVREILLRKSPLQPGKMLFFLTLSVCLAFSVFYELIEWCAALVLGQGADAFLATQGDVWDTQWDMFLALCGAVISQVLLSPLHNRQLSLLKLER